MNRNEITGRLECRRCFFTDATAEAELVAQAQAEGW
jgi:hypothetical protein